MVEGKVEEGETLKEEARVVEDQLPKGVRG